MLSNLLLGCYAADTITRISSVVCSLSTGTLSWGVGGEKRKVGVPFLFLLNVALMILNPFNPITTLYPD